MGGDWRVASGEDRHRYRLIAVRLLAGAHHSSALVARHSPRPP